MPKQIFINLPVKDLKKSMAFYEAMGFTNNPQFTDETAACMVWSDSIFVMLLTHDKFKQFIGKSIIEGKQTVGVINALSVESYDEVNAFMDKAVAAGYLEVQPPILVNHDSGFGTGQLPDKEGQMYFVSEDQLYLIPTAEVPVTNIYRNTILKESDFPQKLTAYTPCFRREAGSYGKDVRGLNRLHQFDKVEIVRIEHPENSYQVLEEMKDYVCSLLEQLELPYRVLKLCGGDMSFASALTYDMEVFSAAQEKWLEVSSVSNFESFQSNRLKLRFKGNDGKTQLAHTLNGSALALPRIVAALLENNYNGQYIQIPKAIQHYTGFDRID